MLDEELIEKFVVKVQTECNYKKWLQADLIEKIIKKFEGYYSKQDYPNNINNCLEIALQFYESYNNDFYKMILDGIANKRIIIDNELKYSYVNLDDDMARIKTRGNDSDLFLLVHEFAHYIDRNSTPKILENRFAFCSEVFSFFMEKRLELWLDKDLYNGVISARNNNRIYFEAKMLKAIEYELYYEMLYLQNGEIMKTEMDIKKIKNIMRYKSRNLVNYLLRYPFANILSDYLIKNDFNIESENFCETCLQADLYSIVNQWSINDLGLRLTKKQ